MVADLVNQGGRRDLWGEIEEIREIAGRFERGEMKALGKKRYFEGKNIHIKPRKHRNLHVFRAYTEVKTDTLILFPVPFPSISPIFKFL